MEHYKISKLLNDSTILKSVTKKWIEVNDLSRFKTSFLILDLCDYSDACIVVIGRITSEGDI